VANELKNYDAFQVLRSVFDVNKNCLRVCVVDGSPGGGGGVEVIITHTEDSIRLGNGTNFFTSTTIGSKLGLDVSVIKDSTNLVTLPVIANISVPTANIEQSYSLPSNTKRFKLQARGDSKIQLAYTNGQTNVQFITVFPGNDYNEINIEGSLTLYFRTNKNNETIEILSWS